MAILEQNGIDAEVVRYLETPPSATQIKQILKALNIPARQLMRQKEAEYKDLNLADDTLTESQLIEAMVTTPKLIERPIVLKGSKAVLGRPPENVLELIQ